MKKFSINKLIQSLLAHLQPRQVDVLECRYGLKDKPKMTLAEIGDKYSITRERVRQIENLTLNSVRNKLNRKDFELFIGAVFNLLNQMGGIRREDFLSSDLKKIVSDSNDKSFNNKVKFLLEVIGRPNYQLGDNNYYSYWYVNEDFRNRASSFVSKLTEVLSSEGDWKAEMKATAFSENDLSLSKNFSFNCYGEFGLADWPHINPKTARDWSYLVLKRNQKPLHFVQLAKIINTLRKGKVTNVQTVHNELIKDDRFVLVGRGIYGLKEFNLVSGTCREVISKVLKEHGPKTSKELIKLVTDKRDFKENTLILNLQNKKHFARLGDGRYALKEV